MEKKKKLIVLGVILLIIVISGITYAILTWQSGNINIGINTNCFTINYAKGNNITGSLKLINEEDLISNGKFTIKEGVGVSGVNIGIKSTCSIEGYGNILLNITNISSVFTTGDSKGALKYAVLKNTSTITDPTQISTTSLLNQSFDIEKKGSITTSGTLKLLTKQLSNTELYKYIIVIYVDNNLAGNDVTEGTFTGNISADAVQGEVPSLANKITNLYTSATKTPKTVNSIEYNLAPSVGLMNDRLGSMSTGIDDGNIRYYGANPNNYIYFNCDDYSNQTSSTCEVWRIIGVFDGKVKIMRNESIGDYSWDNKNTNTGAESNYGKNNWTDSTLMKILNAGYESETGGSLYWNRQSGTCYSRNSSSNTTQTTKTCDMSSIGLKNDITRNMISESTYSLLGWNNSSIYSDQIYNYERTTGSVYNETTRDKSWTGKVALAYPSDYGYAADLSQCTKTLVNYEASTCTSNNWMKSIITNNGGNDGWLLTPHSGYSDVVWFVFGAGYVNGSSRAYVEYRVAPVLHLGSELEIKAGGDGSSSTPYQLSA